MKYLRNEKAIRLFGKKIKDLRKLQNISQIQLAYEAGIPRSQIIRIENGEVNTSISTVFAIAAALGLEAKELFDF